MISLEFATSLRCPKCAGKGGGRLNLERGSWLICQEPGCGRKYPASNGLTVMLLEEGEKWINVDLVDLPSSALPAMPTPPDPAWLARKAQELRISILEMVIRAGGGHIGGAYSVIDVMTALYFRVMKHDPSNPSWEDRDRLIFSKGHGCLALYTVLAHSGYFPKRHLHEFCQDGGLLGGHPERIRIPGVEVTGGSLGHGLPLATGMGLACKMDGGNYKVFVVLSDGECNEGSVWEALMSAAQLGLAGLVAIIDNNHMESLAPTSEILSIEPMGDRLRSFGWSVLEVDGHDMTRVVDALEGTPFEPKKPSALVLHTIKGKGVSFMESVPKWHLRGPTPEEAQTAFSELAGGLTR